MEKPDDSQSMEVEREGVEGNVVEEANVRGGVGSVDDGVEAKHCVGDLQSDSVKEMGSRGAEDCGGVLQGSYMEDSVGDKESEKTSNGTLGMEGLSNELTDKSLLAEDVLEEELKNEGELVGVGETNEEVECAGAENGGIVRENEKLVKTEPDVMTPSKSFVGDPNVDGYESGTEEEQMAFLHEIEVFFSERGMEFKPPKFYQEQLNLLKLWRWVIKLGGYEQVSSNKLWRQVGESFKPPKTCTTVSWSFRCFYEKALLEYEKHKILSGELPEIDASLTDFTSPVMQGSLSQPSLIDTQGALSQPALIDMQGALSQPSGVGRVRRDAAARAMQVWHSLRDSSNVELGDPIIKDKSSIGLGKREKQHNSLSLLKRPKQSHVDQAAKFGHLTSTNSEHKITVVDVGPLSDWVKINVQRTKDCYELYVLVPGFSREEVRVQSDPSGRLVISGQPEHLDNPWGITPFKKVISLPSRIDPHQTSAVVTLHGQLFIRAPFEQSDS